MPANDAIDFRTRSRLSPELDARDEAMRLMYSEIKMLRADNERMARLNGELKAIVKGYEFRPKFGDEEDGA